MLDPSWESSRNVEPASTIMDNSADWETVSDDVSFERPVLKSDVPKLAEVPLKTMLNFGSIEWMAPILNYSCSHKGYELQIVRNL